MWLSFDSPDNNRNRIDNIGNFQSLVTDNNNHNNVDSIHQHNKGNGHEFFHVSIVAHWDQLSVDQIES